MSNIVKDKRRQRYIGFIIHTNFQIPFKTAIQKEIQKQCKSIYNKECRDMGIMLIRFDGNQGIIKCDHFDKENVIILLRSIKEIANQDVKIETIATSGTIHSLINKHMNFNKNKNNNTN